MADDKTKGIQPQEVAMTDGNLKRRPFTASLSALRPNASVSLMTIRYWLAPS